MARLFRFTQRLTTILAGRELTADERAHLDAYDLYLEDFLSSLSEGTPPVGGGGGDSLWEHSGGFLEPIYDDGEWTKFDIGPTASAAIAPATFLSLISGQQMTLDSGQEMTLNAGQGLSLDTAAGFDIDIGQTVSGGDIAIGSGGGGTTSIRRDGGNIELTVNGGYIVVGALPTSDPGIPGAIYSLLGVLHVSP